MALDLVIFDSRHKYRQLARDARHAGIRVQVIEGREWRSDDHEPSSARNVARCSIFLVDLMHVDQARVSYEFDQIARYIQAHTSGPALLVERSNRAFTEYQRSSSSLELVNWPDLGLEKEVLLHGDSALSRRFIALMSLTEPKLSFFCPVELERVFKRLVAGQMAARRRRRKSRDSDISQSSSQSSDGEAVESGSSQMATAVAEVTRRQIVYLGQMLGHHEVVTYWQNLDVGAIRGRAHAREEVQEVLQGLCGPFAVYAFAYRHKGSSPTPGRLGFDTLLRQAMIVQIYDQGDLCESVYRLSASNANTSIKVCDSAQLACRAVDLICIVRDWQVLENAEIDWHNLVEASHASSSPVYLFDRTLASPSLSARRYYVI